MSTDADWMKRALELAERGRGHVEPNPLVGAVVVRDGQVVGEGWHERFGAAHAEVNALSRAGELARGATLYITLEPCCHQGKTPPCTEAILAAEIRRVVTAMLDPFPQVAGRGASLLRAAGVEVEVGVCQAEGRRLNAPYLKLLGAGRPYVHAKWAMTLDGKIATRSRQSHWISNEASRRVVHQLRGRMDGIVIGVGTALADNPELTARPLGPRTATRIVLDSNGRLWPHSVLVRTAQETPTLVVCTANTGSGNATTGDSGLRRRKRDSSHDVVADAPAAAPTNPSSAPTGTKLSALDVLRAAGCEILTLPGEGRPDILTLLDELGRRRMTNLLVEGGAEVLGSFVDEDAIDEFHIFISPRIVGGREAVSAIGGLGAEKMTDALALVEWHIEHIEGDIYLRGWRRRAGSSGSRFGTQ